MARPVVLQTRCGACHRELNLPERTGSKFRCPRCEATLVVPPTEEVEAAKPDRLILEPIEPPRKPVEPEPLPEPEAKPARELGRHTRQVLKEVLHERPTQSLDDLCSDGPEIEY